MLSKEEEGLIEKEATKKLNQLSTNNRQEILWLNRYGIIFTLQYLGIEIKMCFKYRGKTENYFYPTTEPKKNIVTFIKGNLIEIINPSHGDLHAIQYIPPQAYSGKRPTLYKVPYGRDYSEAMNPQPEESMKSKIS